MNGPVSMHVLTRRLLADQLTPVLAYRRLVAPDDREAPSFLFESVENGSSVGRWSMLGAQPVLEVLARGHDVEVRDRRRGRSDRMRSDNPLDAVRAISSRYRPAPQGPLPAAFHGGWVGYCAFDAVRWLEPGKLPFAAAPHDDRGLPDMHFGMYREVAVFDHVSKVVHAVVSVPADEHPDDAAALAHGRSMLDAFCARLLAPGPALAAGAVDLDLSQRPTPPGEGPMPRAAFEAAVQRAQEYIRAGDAFQVVLSRRMERTTGADPFDVYRALRVVNPSPYQIYLQAEGSILVASSPEILCRVRGGTVTNRPLAGTRRRGRDAGEDEALEHELLADEKERAEHVMLVDLGRNDLGRVCEQGTVRIERCMEVERYSHVMHISSTVTGRLRAGLDCWDALRATLPVGTVSGAPKVRAIQIIDELEPVRRGPYSGGIGAVGWDGDMDIALALRTMVIPTARHRAGVPWRVDLQAGAGIVLDSVPAAEFEETLAKGAALGRAIDLAECAFAR
ncbi:MAG: anthranilate synthase component I [Planctomycetes bacterium]|nr:anthranilate synthase component I [Planctomycetota bacterium]